MKHSVLASAIMLVAASVFGAAPDYTANLEFVANPNKVGFSKEMARAVYAMQFFHGKIYNGGGEVEKNLGPVKMYATDPISKTFVYEGFEAPAEEICCMRIASWGDLLASNEDPKSGSSSIFRRTPEGEWSGHAGPYCKVKVGTQDPAAYHTHNWDLVEFDDRLFVACYGIYASTDHGYNFTDVSPAVNYNNGYDMVRTMYFPGGKGGKASSDQILLREQFFVKVDNELFSVYHGILSPNASRSDNSNYNKTKGMWYNSSKKEFELIDINLEDVFPNVTGADFALSCGMTSQDWGGNTPSSTAFRSVVRLWHTTPFKGRCLYVGCVDNESYWDGDTSYGGTYRNSSYPLSIGGFSAEKATGSGDFTHRFQAKKLNFGTETFPMDFCVVGDVCYALTTHFNATTQLVEHKIWKTTDGENFTEVVKFDFHQNFISLARYDGNFYVGAGWKGVRHDYNYNSAADEVGAIYRIPDPEMASRVIVTAPTTKVGEGQQVAVSVKLSAAPSENVTLTVGANTANTVSLDKTSLTFTPSNYNTPQTVNVSVSEVSDITPIAIFCGKGGGSSVLGEYENSVVASGTAAVPVKMPESYSSKWWYDATTKTITDYIWKFNATLSETSITVGVPVDDECPTEVTPLDFSKPVVDLADGTTAYTITTISTEFQKNGAAARASAQYVGELTLPGEGLKEILADAFRSCSNLTGSVVFPTTLTTLGIAAFQDSGVQAVDFKPATASIPGNYGRGAFKDCTSLERVRFRAGGSFSITSGYTFNGCTALKDVDLSGVTSVSVSKGSYGIFAGCTSLTNITFGSTLALSGGEAAPGYSVFSSTQKELKSIHFTGAPPADFESWITADGGYLSLIGATQKVSTYVPEANVDNWKKYSASGSIAGSGTTFASTYLKSGVDPANRPLLIAGAAPAEPEDDPVVVHTHVWGNWVTNVFPTATADGQCYRECTASGCSNPPERQYQTIPATGGGEEDDPQEGSDLTASLVNHGIPLSSKYTTQYYARNPWDLKAFEGRLYIGSGNSANTGPNTNAGPVPIKSYNPATSNCVDELVIQQEQIDVFRILDDGGLYIPGHDPKGGNGSVYLRSPGSSGANAWKQFNNLTGCEHCYDVTMFDGKFIASGSNLWISPNTNAANVAAFTAYSISGRRYSMLRFPNTLYAVGTAMVGGTVGTLTYADSFGIDRLPKGGTFAPIKNAGSYADKQYVFPGIDDMVVKKEYIVQRPVSFGSRVIYIGGLNHNDHQLLPLAAFSAVDGEVCFTATRIALPEGAVPWDTLVAGDKVYLLWTTKSGDKFINHVSESSDGLAFTEIFCFTADSFARSFEYLKRRFYFGLGAENVDIFNPYSAANNSLLSAASGTILSCPYDLNLPEDDIEYPQEDEPVTPPDPSATAKAVWDANTNTFTFYYDTNTYEGNGITQYALPTENKWNTEPAWKGADWKSSVTKVVFAASFAAYQPINMNYWFDGFSNLTTIEGMEYLKTSSAGYCTSMFGGCSSLTSLDLSHFDTTTMKFRNFFNGCSNIEVLDLTSFTKFSDLRGAFSGMSTLKTIYVADILDCDADSTTSDTFKGCNALVGGGNPPTTFAEAKITHGGYARIDNPPDEPGYFTLKGTEPIVPPDDPEDPPAGTVTITLTAPADGAMYDTHLQALKKYLANSDARSEFPDDDLIAARDTDGNHYVHNAWFTNLLVEASVEQATYKPFTWEKTGDITDIVVEYSEDAAFTEGKVISEKYCRDNETSTRPLNLKLATKYWWRVKAKDANGGDVVSDVRTFTTEGVAPRIIGTLGFNMRDLGGGTNAEGLVVRQGLILRGKCPMARVNAEAGWNDQKMTEQSYREFYLDKHHIKTELDFRSAEEALEHQTRYDEIEISTIGIDHFNMEIYPYHYGHALTSSNICQAVKMLAEGTHYPVYFNCAVGSDRTGTFGTIIDGIVGRDDQWFYDNYELPSFDSGLARLRYNRKGSEMFEYLQARNPGEHFRDRVVQYLLGIGVTREDIRAIREAMLELPNEGDTRELKSAKAVYTEADQTLTLRYDDQDYSGVDGQLQCAVSRGGWESLTNDVRHLVFAPSFADYRVESCLQWFENFKVLEDVAGLEYFDTSLATTLRGMFTGCSSLTEIDFSGHDLSKCTNLGNMFYKCSALKSVDFTDVDTSNVVDFYRTFSGCSSLTNIYVTEEFDASGYTDLTKEVFKGCSKLVGGAGTKFSSEHVNVEYARLDNPTDGKPGYFTLKGAVPVDPPVVEHKHVWGNWVTNKVATATEAGERYRECTAEGCTNPVARETETIPALGGGDDPDPQEDDPVTPYPADPEDPDKDLPEDAELAARAVRIGDTIRFYYDKKSHTRDGSTVSVIPVAGTRNWLAPTADNYEITNVIFYSSFKSFKPQSMAGWFHYYRALKNVVGLHNIDTSEVTRMDNLFRCKSGNNPNIIELDLSAWDTRSCMNMSYMFARLSGLKTIYVSDKFVVTQVTASDSMFDRCSAIVGGAGTKYLDSTEGKNKTRAKVDGGTEDPGYFTYRAVSSDPVIVKPELGSATIVTGDSKTFRISVSNPVVGAAYTLFTATALDGEFTAESDSTIYASGDLLLDFAIEDGVPQKFAKIVISTTPYKQGDPLPEE